MHRRLGFCCWAVLLSYSTLSAADVDVKNEDDGKNTFQDTSFSTFGTFLKETVFGQGGLAANEDSTNYDPFSNLMNGEYAEKDSFARLSSLFQAATKAGKEGAPQSNDGFLSNLITSVAWSQQQESEPFDQLVAIFWNATKRVSIQLENTFKDAFAQFTLNPLQAFYHMQQQEALRNSVYKRRQHAFMPKLTLKQAVPLADGLFLSQLAYVNTCNHVQEHLESFHNNSWALLNCSVTGKPSQPAHFVAVRKEAEPMQSDKNLWERLLGYNDDGKNALEVVIVIRGSKEIADFISDGLLEAVDYRGGKAHDGIVASAQWLHQQYEHFFLRLLKLTGRRRMKVWCVGHSLGAGTAALASLEFNAAKSNDGAIEAHSLGFGTPAIVSKELSLALKTSVTTVINDADCVPRMSGATLVNAWIKAASYQDWMDEAQHDIRLLMNVMKENFPFPDLIETLLGGLLVWLDNTKEKQQRPIQNETKKFHAEPLLFPPGDCIHLYRDSTQWQCVYMPCIKFDEIEAVGHLVWDHLIPSGYYVGLLQYVRGLTRDWNWSFDPDLMKLPVPP